MTTLAHKRIFSQSTPANHLAPDEYDRPRAPVLQTDMTGPRAVNFFSREDAAVAGGRWEPTYS